MSYTKQNFVDGNTLTASELNHIEDGIKNLENTVNNISSTAGKDGISPTVTVSKSGKVTTVKITDKDGTKTATINDGADGKTPVRGTDYWTEADKAEIKAYVDEAILNGSW